MEGISTIVAGLSAIVTGLAGAGYVLGLIALAWPVYSRITGDAYTALYAVSLVPKTVVIGQGLRIMVGTALMTWGLRIALFTVAFIGVPITVALLGVGVIDVVLEYMGRSGTSLGDSLDRVILQIVTATIVLFFLWLLEKLETAVGGFETTSFFRFLYLKPGAPPPPVKATFILFGLVGGAIVGAVVYEFQFQLGWSAFFIILIAVFLIGLISGVPYAVSLSIDTPLPKVRMTVIEAGNGGDPITTEGRLVAHSEGVFYVFEESTLIAVPDGGAKIIRVP